MYGDRKRMDMVKSGKKGGNRIGRCMTPACLACAVLALAVSGCSRVQDDGQGIIVVEQEAEPIVYDMVVAMPGDVQKTQRIKCVYQQLNEESLSFGISGISVRKVYVQEGDAVEKGQVLAELSSADQQEDIAWLEYQIARSQLQMDYLEINEDYEISSLWLNYLYQSGKSQREKELLEENVARVQQNYTYTREDYEDDIMLNSLALEQLKSNASASLLVAGMSGTVSRIKKDLEGSTSVRGEEVMTIIDGSECLIVTEVPEYASFFQEGTEVYMDIAYGTSAGRYGLFPRDMEQWGQQQYFSLAESGSNAAIEVGTIGSIVVLVDQRTDVLCLPSTAVHSADGRDYVYVLGEDQIREVKWIETGLHGDDMVEVLAGLTEGERVILR